MDDRELTLEEVRQFTCEDRKSLGPRACERLLFAQCALANLVAENLRCEAL